MTGGAGFAKQGHDSFKHNRALRNGRSSLKDNPYAGTPTPAGVRNARSATEVQAWLAQKKLKEQYLRRIISFVLVLVAGVALLFALL